MSGAVTAASSRHLGVDLGATNLKWCVVERRVDEWRVVDRGQVPTLAAEGEAAVIDRIVAIGREAVERWPGVSTVGIGVPGLYDPTTGTTRFLVNMPGGWKGTAVTTPVREALGLPAVLINDARAFGLAELRLGAGRGARSMVGLTLGTGVGGVIAVEGRVHQGHDGTAGEVGHQTLDPDGPPCNCGNNGCLEAYARADRIAEACGTPSAEAAIAAARAGEARAVEGMSSVGRWLGIGIANLITLISPDRVVIGGGNAVAGDLLFEPMHEELQRRVHTTALEPVTITTAELGTWAGAIGAAVHGAEQAAVAAAAVAGAASTPAGAAPSAAGSVP